MFAMCRVPLVFTVNRWFRDRCAPLRKEVIVRVGNPEAIQVRFSEARVVKSAFIAKTTVS